MDENIQKKIDEWTTAPFDNETISEIKAFVSDKNEKELTDRFYKNLEFGTGGLRGITGAGTNRMNIYTVGMSTQGLADYIISKKLEEKGVVIARDSRRMSDIFANETAAILAGNGINVFIFDDITPTPFASFAIRELKAVSGVVVTASHNPPEYNGYKVYWENGGQVIPPYDSEIIERVKQVDSITKIKKIDFQKGIDSGLIKKINGDITKSYLKNLDNIKLREIKNSNIKIVYTPLHGTGYKIVPEILSHFGFKNIYLVEKQAVPDGSFPTVDYPNPEEKKAMKLAVDLAKEKDADIIMATDPDADRMGIGFKGENGEYKLINGNQIGTMLEYYILSRLKQKDLLPENGVVIKTIVTTELQNEIAESFNCETVDVLTGFKWIASEMSNIDKNNDKKFIFGGEESFGYLPVDFVRDKDAVSSIYFFAEMADWLNDQGKTMSNFLDEIYIKYSYYLEDLHSLTLKGIDGTENIKKIMRNFRTSPPEEFAGIKIDQIWDIQNLVVKNLKSGTEEPIQGLPSSNVIQFYLHDGSKITLRPSGTEPKIKFYFSVNCKTSAESIKDSEIELRNKLGMLKKDLLMKVEDI